MLNDYGLNPAIAGSTRGWNILMGRRAQWRGFAFAPETNFISVTKEFGKKSYKHYWHGVGAYIEQDKFGVFENKVGYGSYSLHLKLVRKYYLSFGVAVGVKQVNISNVIIDNSNTPDPALVLKDESILLYPDIIPGLYFYSSKLSVSVSVRNIYKNTLTASSKLDPTAYITVSKKIVSSGYDFVFIPAIHVQSTFSDLPFLHFNYMAYYRKRVGLGLTYRLHDAVSAVLQVRVFSNLVIGFAYDYTISKFHSANANSTEFMMGFSPLMNYETRNNVAECPKFEY